MKRSTQQIVGCFLALFVGFSFAQGPPVKRPPAKVLPLKILGSRVVPMLGPIQCKPDVTLGADCVVPITMTHEMVGGVEVCVANLSSQLTIHGASPTSKEKVIVWGLNPTTLDGASFAFQETYGILIVKNGNGQLIDPTIGAGGSTKPNPAYFRVTNQLKLLAESIYLPIILQTRGDVVTLCAAIDPKIVNDN